MMQVVKRDGSREDVSFDKVLNRLIAVSKGLDVNPTLIAQQTLTRIYNGVRTSELDEQAALLSFSLCTIHYDYGTLAARIAISNHQKNTEKSFSEVMISLANQVHPATNEPIRYVSEELEAIVREHGAGIDARIDYERDFLFDYFGFKTLERSYLLKNSAGRILERPQHLWMRVSLGIWGSNLEEAFKTYDLMSQKFMTHATPTLFNSGTPRPQLSSCFLTAIEDSISGIYKTLSDCAAISKYAGGIGMHIHNVRAKGSLIRGTNGTSNGIVPMLRVFNATARYVDQCFAPFTPIDTDKGPLPICDVKEGDKVLSSLGTYVNVNKGLIHEYNGKMYKISVEYSTTIVQVTPEHPILSIRNVAGAPKDIVLKKYANGLLEMDYNEAGCLRVGDLIVSPSSPSGFSYRTITGIEETSYDGLLYDFEVDSPHDYCVSGFGIAHNGGGKRNGSFAIYLEPWHADVEDFLMMKRNTGTEEERARDLFYALWIPDLFMERVEADQEWTLFCPGEAPGLADVHGDEFRALYERYEREGRGRRKVSAQKLWFKILDSQIETGTPYLLYKDAANAKSNQKNLGTIKSSNLCVTGDTLILTDRGEIPIRDAAEAAVPVNVWNGEAWSSVTPVKTGTNQMVGLIVVKDTVGDRSQLTYRVLECTPYHKFLIQGCADRKDAADLECGDRIETWYTPSGERVESEIVINSFKADDVKNSDHIRYTDTYCFNEPLRHAGVFNGILAGNCTEIIEYSSPEETAVCNLASIALPAFVDQKKRVFDYDRLREVTRQATRNLNRVIDVNFYPTPETKRSNMRHRPIGIGVQGLADVFAMMRLAWESENAAELNQRIFENIYYAAVEESAARAKVEGAYETWEGSPAWEGQLQHDMWNVTPLTEADGTLDWKRLRETIRECGLRNSLLIAPMPTASTSQILGYNECIEPMTSNIYSRRTLAGEFIMVNRYLMKDLMRYQVWSEDVKQKIIALNGSIQDIPEIPDALKSIYKTAWEMKQRTLIDMAAARGAFICQSQSLNLFVQEPTYAKLTSMHFYAWRKGLKTGVYYLRTKAPFTAQKFTVDPALIAAVQKDKERRAEEEAAADAGCLHCSA